jgi:hypothetical protein
MGMIKKFIENFKRDWVQAAENICDSIAVIDGQRYAVFYKRRFFGNRINKNRIRLMTKLPTTVTARGSSGGNMTYKEAVEALRQAGATHRPGGRPNPLDDLKF